MKKALFLYNPLSGQGKIKESLSDILDLITKAGFEVTIHPTQAAKDGMKKVIESAAEYDRIFCSGGDGTLDEVVTGLMRLGLSIPIGYIPAGSTNDFGKSLGLDGSLISSTNIAVGEDIFVCDVGRFNDDYFVYVAAFGLFTEASYTTSQDLKNIFGHAAYILEGAKQLADIPSYKMSIEAEGIEEDGEFLFGMVTNSDTIGGFKGLVPADVSLNDGEFEVTLIRTPKNPIDLSEIIAYFTNFNKDTQMVLGFRTNWIRIASEEPVPWTLDGEFGGNQKSVAIRNIPGALNILARIRA